MWPEACEGFRFKLLLWLIGMVDINNNKVTKTQQTGCFTKAINFPFDNPNMSIILLFFTQCTQAEAQLQAAERRIADILGKDTSSLQEGECFISVSFLAKCM